MNSKSKMTLIALAAVACANADVTSIKSALIYGRVFNDVPSSTFSFTNNYPSHILLRDEHVSAASGFANRHVWKLSADGTNPYSLEGPDDTFEMFFDVTVNGPISPRKEAGFLINAPVDGLGWISDCQYIVNSDGREVVLFGLPSPFYSFNNDQGIYYDQGTTLRMGLRYYKDPIDSKYKFIWFAGGAQSPALTLEDVGGVYNFGANGLRAGTILGGYLQIVNDSGNPDNFGQATFDNVSIDPFPAVKGTVTLGDYPALTGNEVVDVEVRIPGTLTVLQSTTARIKAGGKYAFKPTVGAGAYDIAIKGSHWLRSVATNVAITDIGASGVNVSLANGDAQPDNEVNLADYSAIASSFLSLPGDGNWNPNADLNGDEEVNLADYSIMSIHFGQAGDE